MWYRLSPMSSTPKVHGFHHVAIRARDFDRSVRFYTQVLGLTQKIAWNEAPKRAIMLDAGDGSYVEIFERPDQPAPPQDEPAILHFALRTSDTDGLLERARQAGCEVTVEPKTAQIANTVPTTPTPVPARLAFFKGPDGELVELFQNELT